MSDPVKSPDPLYDPIYGDAVVLITDLKAEIAALKAERAVLQGVVTSYAMTERELKAERDWLRAALERIAHGETDGWGGAEIARRALEQSKR
jgi:hypothetical protein